MDASQPRFGGPTRRRSFTPAQKLDHVAVTHLYGPIVDIIRSRHLQTVTLDDAWYGTKGRNRTVQPTPQTS